MNIVWPDGKRMEADSYDELYDLIRAEQHGLVNDVHFRLVMRRRARIWSDSKLILFGSKEQFIKRMARARMFKLELTD